MDAVALSRNTSWDYENHLTGITGGGLTASYSYDYLGRRKSKTVNGVATTFLYDGQNLIRESSTTTGDYVFGPGIDEPLAQSRASAISYYDVDALGSTTALDDAAGSLQNSYIYDAWGVSRNQTGTLQNSFIYASRELAEGNLYYYRARSYDPSIGRFVSEDFRRFDAGVNFYTYVLNDPVTFADPSGEFVIPFPVPPTSMFPPLPAPPPQPSCPSGRDCDQYGKGGVLYKICMGTPNDCWGNCVRKCLLTRYGKHNIGRYLFIDHPICFWICPTTCPVTI